MRAAAALACLVLAGCTHAPDVNVLCLGRRANSPYVGTDETELLWIYVDADEIVAYEWDCLPG